VKRRETVAWSKATSFVKGRQGKNARGREETTRVDKLGTEGLHFQESAGADKGREIGSFRQERAIVRLLVGEKKEIATEANQYNPWEKNRQGAANSQDIDQGESRRAKRCSSL